MATNKTTAADTGGVFTRAEITTFLNNLVVMARKPPGWERTDGVPDKRLGQLRKVAEALLETLRELVDGDALRWEEAVLTLVVLAEMIQIMYINGSASVPTGVVSADTLAAIKRLIKRPGGL